MQAVTQQAEAEAFSKNLGENLVKMHMTVFFEEVYSKFYESDPDYNGIRDFMDYFLTIIRKNGQFVIKHDLLKTCGVTTSDRSSNVKRRLTDLGMREGKHYILKDDLGQNTGHGGSNKKAYFLTPSAFKKCLMRAQQHGNKGINPEIYCDYFILLETIHLLYTDYQKSYDAKMMSIKDDKIDTLTKKFDEQFKENKNLTKKIDELLGHTIEVKEDNKIVKTELVEVKTELAEVNTKFEKVSTTLVETKNEFVKFKETSFTMFKSLADTVNSAFSNINNMFVSFTQKTQSEETGRYFDDLSDIGSIKIQYIIETINDKGRTELFFRCTNIRGIIPCLRGIGRKCSIHAVAVNCREINFELAMLKEMFPTLSKRKSIILKRDKRICDLINYILENQVQSFDQSNEVTSYFVDQDWKYLVDTRKSLQRLLDIYTDNNGNVISPKSRLLKERLLEVETQVHRVYNDEERIIEIVNTVGEEKVKQDLMQIEYYYD